MQYRQDELCVDTERPSWEVRDAHAPYVFYSIFFGLHIGIWHGGHGGGGTGYKGVNDVKFLTCYGNACNCMTRVQSLIVLCVGREYSFVYGALSSAQ